MFFVVSMLSAYCIAMMMADRLVTSRITHYYKQDLSNKVCLFVLSKPPQSVKQHSVNMRSIEHEALITYRLFNNKKIICLSLEKNNCVEKNMQKIRNLNIGNVIN